MVTGLLLLGPALNAADLTGATIIATKGGVELSRAGATAWDPAQPQAVLQAGDRIRTKEHSRATLRLRDATILPVDELTTLRIAPAEGRTVVELLKGVLSFFHRDEPGDVEVRSGGTSALIRGTEFTVSVDDRGTMQVALFDGSVEVTNTLGRVVARPGDLLEVPADQAPRTSPALAGSNLRFIQWVLHYPMVLDPADLPETLLGDPRWSAPLADYRAGAPVAALEAAKRLGEPANDAERLLHGALRLAVGDVPGFERFTGAIAPEAPEARAVKALAGVVESSQFRSRAERWEGLLSEAGPATVTELLAGSYAFQSLGRLEEARGLARRAAGKSPGFGPVHLRLAELELAFGRTGVAADAVARGLVLSPRHAAGTALDGFLLAAGNRFEPALRRFDQAIVLDPVHAPAWLGRGLIRFRTGDSIAGRVDLETAAALDPLHAVLRSYLAKAFAEEGQDAKALEELSRALGLDPQDPTPWLYSALLHYRRYEFAKAIAAMDQSLQRNGNRAVYRSRLLLDQDAAVRSANQANIFELADMAEVARRESARAVMFDYANASAHLNLATSHNAQRDPTRFNLRNETVWFNEHLLASLLAPTATMPLSQNLSQNEYSRLFARDVVRINGTTEYFSSGEIRQLASQSANFSRFSYALDLDYGSKPGFRSNEDLSRIEWYTRAKFELSPSDSVMLLTKYQDFEAGDNFQYANPARLRPNLRFTEKQAPILLGGYHREWSPGSHTLLLGGRLENDQRLSDLAANQFLAFANPPGVPASAAMNLAYRGRFEIYSAEASHILQTQSHTTVAGVRVQSGDFDSVSRFDATPSGFPDIYGPLVTTRGGGGFERRSGYLYHTWEVLPDLRLTGGFAYDDLTLPLNHRRSPLVVDQRGASAASPKAALVWSPGPVVTVRGLYAESLGGVSYDESIRLEPTQLAGFPQAFRTLISESLVGSVEAPGYRSAGGAVDLKLPTRTYLSVEGRWLASEVDQPLGYFAFDFDRPSGPLALPETTSRRFDYREHGARVLAHQILAEEWFVQGTYEFTRAGLATGWPAVPASADFPRTWRQESDLHRLGASVLYQRPDGWFGRIAATGHLQDNLGQWYPGDAVPTGDQFAHLNLFLGYRFPRHRGDLTLGLLNVGDRNYRLHPLTPFDEMPRERMLYLRFRFNL
jgi:tetratricopeptide (TPR) repeat protein